MGLLGRLVRKLGRTCAARRIRRAAAFSIGREPVSHEVFREAIGLPAEDQRLVTLLRRTVGIACCVEPRLLGPDLPVKDLRPLWPIGFDGWDELEVIFRLEKVARVKIFRGEGPDEHLLPPSYVKGDLSTFGLWVAANVPRLQARMVKTAGRGS